MESVKISKTLLRRLPIYLEHLKSLPEEVSHVSATAIARDLGLGHVLVRKDLAKISTEGRCRTGRSRKQLIQDIEEYLDFCADFSERIGINSGVVWKNVRGDDREALAMGSSRKEDTLPENSK